jgi:hypothetical protein
MLKSLNLTGTRTKVRMRPPITDRSIMKAANALAEFNKSDCYAYRVNSHCVIYTSGPDQDHPSRKPFFIARYYPPLRIVK